MCFVKADRCAYDDQDYSSEAVGGRSRQIIFMEEGCIRGPGKTRPLCPAQILTDRGAGNLATQSDLFVGLAVMPLESQNLFDLAHG